MVFFSNKCSYFKNSKRKLLKEFHVVEIHIEIGLADVQLKNRVVLWKLLSGIKNSLVWDFFDHNEKAELVGKQLFSQLLHMLVIRLIEIGLNCNPTVLFEALVLQLAHFANCPFPYHVHIVLRRSLSGHCVDSYLELLEVDRLVTRFVLEIHILTHIWLCVVSKIGRVSFVFGKKFIVVDFLKQIFSVQIDLIYKLIVVVDD